MFEMFEDKKVSSTISDQVKSRKYDEGCKENVSDGTALPGPYPYPYMYGAYTPVSPFAPPPFGMPTGGYPPFMGMRQPGLRPCQGRKKGHLLFL